MLFETSYELLPTCFAEDKLKKHFSHSDSFVLNFWTDNSFTGLKNCQEDFGMFDFSSRENHEEKRYQKEKLT